MQYKITDSIKTEGTVVDPVSSRRIMLITNALEQSPNGGREMLCRLNYDCLHELYADNLVLFELEKNSPGNLADLMKAFNGHIDGIYQSVIASLLTKIRDERIDTVFIDGSNLGKVAECVRNEFKNVKIITFFHNVEAAFFWDSIKQLKTLRSVAVTLINYIAERKSVLFSDRLICLSERDSNVLNKLYARKASDISAIALKDSYSESNDRTIQQQYGRYALFVGGTFYANLSGIRWYAKNVAPRLDLKTLVVGKGFERYKSELESGGQIEVIGGVDSVVPWYNNAEFVVAPIFGGSGMKTKVAEALMYGKKIIGTAEAFSGYEDTDDFSAYVCNTANEFVAAIEAINLANNHGFDKRLREIYESTYSFPAASARLKIIMAAL
jgi:polysaccharide biosynthesis protein PslH